MIIEAPELSPEGFRTHVIVPADSPIKVPILSGDQDWGGLVDLSPPTEAWPRHLLGGTLAFHSGYADLLLGFQDEVEPIRFVGLKFGASLLHEGAELSAYAFPPPGVDYVSTEPSQLWIDAIRFEYDPDEEYEVVVWVEEQGKRYESRWFFLAPRPPQPYPSWAWDNEQKLWMPPVPFPDEDGDFMWDEGTLSWVPRTGEFSTFPDPCDETVNINTADFDTLRALHGVDEVRAQAIIDGRPWASVYDLCEIDGINKRMIREWDVET